ncbi:hypothetical protein [Salinisphaera sp. LB1]|uniref:hypothetical protein n=1 Tax=Salinisphaera sp. LB1 TaxID=2183911 RepID=UPI000FF51192|nr:hypothetical protein [Salinisphaera sp. LB1]
MRERRQDAAFVHFVFAAARLASVPGEAQQIGDRIHLNPKRSLDATAARSSALSS